MTIDQRAFEICWAFYRNYLAKQNKSTFKENKMAISENDNEIAKNAEDIEYIFPLSTVEPLSEEYPDEPGEYYSHDKKSS